MPPTCRPLVQTTSCTTKRFVQAKHFELDAPSENLDCLEVSFMQRLDLSSDDNTGPLDHMNLKYASNVLRNTIVPLSSSESTKQDKPPGGWNAKEDENNNEQILDCPAAGDTNGRSERIWALCKANAGYVFLSRGGGGGKGGGGGGKGWT